MVSSVARPTLSALAIRGSRIFLPCAVRLARCVDLVHIELTCSVWEIAPAVLRSWSTLRGLRVVCLALELQVGGDERAGNCAMLEAGLCHMLQPLLPGISRHAVNTGGH